MHGSGRSGFPLSEIPADTGRDRVNEMIYCSPELPESLNLNASSLLLFHLLLHSGFCFLVHLFIGELLYVVL